MALQFNPFTGTFDVTTKGDTGTVAAAGDGTEALPGIAFANDLNTGIYRPGGDQLAISTSGTGRLFVGSDGKIGVGAASTGAYLQVYGVTGSSIITAYGADSDGTADLEVKSNGTAGASRIYFSDTAAQSGLIRYSHNTNSMEFSTAGSERMRLDSSGRLGLGTSSFDNNVLLSLKSDTGTRVCGILFEDTGTSGRKYGVYSGGGNLAFRDFTAGLNRLTIDSSGRVAIGNTVPGSYNAVDANDLVVGTNSGNNGITIVGGSTGYSSLAFADSAGTGGSGDYAGLIQYGHSADSMNFFTGALERARIDSSGRLLVGTTSDSQNSTLVLQGQSSSSAANAVIRLCMGSLPPVDGVLGAIAFGDSGHTNASSIFCSRDGGTWTSGSSQPTRLVFSTTADSASSPTERMRINAAGGFKWSDNATYTSATDAKAEFRQSTNVEGLSVRSTNASFTSSVLLIRADRNASSGEYNFITAGVAGVDNRFIVANSGNVTNTNNSYGAISDLKLKENIVDANSQWDDLKALQVRNYNFIKGQTHTQIGLVAQEVELVSPGLVSESPDLDEEGNDLGTVTKSVNYSVLYMKAVKALQEAMERIENLEAKVAALEGA